MRDKQITLQNLEFHTPQENNDTSSIQILSSSSTDQATWELEQVLYKSEFKDFQQKDITIFYNTKPFDIKEACQSIPGLDYVAFSEKPTEKDLSNKEICFEYACSCKHPRIRMIDRKTENANKQVLHVCLHPYFLEIPITNPKSRDYYIKYSVPSIKKVFIFSTSEETRDEIIRYMAIKNTKRQKALISYPDIDLTPKQREKILASSSIVIYPEDYDDEQKEIDSEFCLKQKDYINIRTVTRNETPGEFHLKSNKEYKEKREHYRHRNETETMRLNDVGSHKLTHLPLPMVNHGDAVLFCQDIQGLNIKRAFITTDNETNRNRILDYIRNNAADFSNYFISYPEYKIEKEDWYNILKKSDLVIYSGNDKLLMKSDIKYMEDNELPYDNKFKILKNDKDGQYLAFEQDKSPIYERHYFRRGNEVLFIPSGENLDSTRIMTYLNKLDFMEINETCRIDRIDCYLLPLTKKLIENPDRNYNEFIKEIHVLTQDSSNVTKIIPINMQDMDSSEWDKMMDVYGSRIGNHQLLDLTRTQDVRPPQMFISLLKEAINTKTENDRNEKEAVNQAFNYKIFISYRQKDRILARAMMQRIHEEKDFEDIAFWYDQELKAGQDFETQIKQAMQDADLILMLVTDNMLKTTSTRIKDDNTREKGNYVSFVEYPMMGKMKEGQKVIPVAFNLNTGIFSEADQAARKSLGQKFSISFYSSKNDETFKKMFPGRPGVDELITDTDTLIKRIRKYKNEAAKSKTDEERAKQKYKLSSFYQKGLRTDLDFNKTIKLLEDVVDISNDRYLKVKAYERLLTIYKNGINNLKDYSNKEKYAKLFNSLMKELSGILKHQTFDLKELQEISNKAKTEEANPSQAKQDYGQDNHIDTPACNSYPPYNDWYNPDTSDITGNRLEDNGNYPIYDGNQDHEVYDAPLECYWEWQINNADEYDATEENSNEIPENNIDPDMERLIESYHNRIALIEKLQGLLEDAIQFILKTKTNERHELQKTMKDIHEQIENHIFSILMDLRSLRTNKPLDNITRQDILDECRTKNKGAIKDFRSDFRNDDLCMLWITLKTLQYKNKRMEFNYGKIEGRDRFNASLSMWNMLNAVNIFMGSFNNHTSYVKSSEVSPASNMTYGDSGNQDLHLKSKTYALIENALLQGDTTANNIFRFKLNLTLSRLSSQNYDLAITNDDKTNSTQSHIPTVQQTSEITPTDKTKFINSFKTKAINMAKVAYHSYTEVEKERRSSRNLIEAAKILCFKHFLSDTAMDINSYTSIEELAWNACKSIRLLAEKDEYTEEYLNLAAIIVARLISNQKINPYDNRSIIPTANDDLNDITQEKQDYLMKTIIYHIDSLVDTSPSTDNADKIKKIINDIKELEEFTLFANTTLQKISDQREKKKRIYLEKSTQYTQLTESHTGMLSEEICSKLPQLCLYLMDNRDNIFGRISPYDIFKTLEYSMSVLASSKKEECIDIYNSNINSYNKTKKKWMGYKDKVIRCKKSIEKEKQEIRNCGPVHNPTIRISNLLDNFKQSFNEHEWYNQDALIIASKISETLKLIPPTMNVLNYYRRFLAELCMPYLENSEENNYLLQEYIDNACNDSTNNYAFYVGTPRYEKQATFFASLTYVLLTSPSYSANKFTMDRNALTRYCYFFCKSTSGKYGEELIESLFMEDEVLRILEIDFSIATDNKAIARHTVQDIHDAYHNKYTSEEIRNNIRSYISSSDSKQAINLFSIFEDELESLCLQVYQNRYKLRNSKKELLNTNGNIITDLKKSIISDIWNPEYDTLHLNSEDLVYTLEHYPEQSIPYLYIPLKELDDIDSKSSRWIMNSLIKPLKKNLDRLTEFKEVLSMLSDECKGRLTEEYEAAIDTKLKEFCPIMLYDHLNFYRKHPEIWTEDINEDNFMDKSARIEKTITVWYNLGKLFYKTTHAYITDIDIYTDSCYLPEFDRAMRAIYVLYEKVHMNSSLKNINIKPWGKTRISTSDHERNIINFEEHPAVSNSIWKSFYELWRPIIRQQGKISWLPILDNDAPIRHDVALMIEDAASLETMTEILKNDATLHVNIRTDSSNPANALEDYGKAEEVLVRLKKFNGSRYLALMSDSIEEASAKSNRMHNLPMTIGDKPLYPFVPDPYLFGISRPDMEKLRNNLPTYRKEINDNVPHSYPPCNPQENNTKASDCKLEIHYIPRSDETPPDDIIYF